MQLTGALVYHRIDTSLLGVLVTQTIHNERLKLIANFCNIVASAVITAGTVGPLITYLYSNLFSGTDPALILTGSLICVLIGGGIHLAGQGVLGGLEGQ